MKKRDAEETAPEDLFDETGDASSPRPDENVVEEIGEEVGVIEAEDEPVHATVDKVARRDVHRWELDPASAEDYETRSRTLQQADELAE